MNAGTSSWPRRNVTSSTSKTSIGTNKAKFWELNKFDLATLVVSLGKKI